MILTLGIVIIILLLTLWIMTTYFSWRINEGHNPRIATNEDVSQKIHQSIRLGRRGTYITILGAKKAYVWIKDKTGKAFVFLVPSAKVAFVEKDELAGLTHGPSSFFLKEITDAKNGIKKRLSKSKKML